MTNLREVVERRLAEGGRSSCDIRAREVRRSTIDPDTLRLNTVEYESGIGQEVFFEFVGDDLATGDERLLGFCRLSLPDGPVTIDEIRNSAMIREVHVYRRGGRLR